MSSQCHHAAVKCPANLFREMKDKVQPKCAFYRKISLLTPEETDLMFKKRIEANDPVALRQMGTKYGAQSNYAKTMECLTKAAELGDAEAQYQLG